MLSDLYEYLSNKVILILGFGREGRSTYNFILRHKDEIALKELIIADQNEVAVDLDSSLNISTVFGKDYLKAMAKADLVLKSPGISFKNFNKHFINDHYEVEKYPGAEISGQVDLFLRFAPGTIIGISGTKGKSTTTSLISTILKAQKDSVYLLGNIGVPVLDHIDDLNEDSFAVLEISAHQLEFTSASPDVAVLTNIYPEHLDHYKSYEEYKAAKINLIRHQDSNDLCVLNINEKELMNSAKGHLEAKLNLILDAQNVYNYFHLIDSNDLNLNKLFVLKQGLDFNIYDLSNSNFQLLKKSSLKQNTRMIGRHNSLDSLLALAATLPFIDDFNLALNSIANFKGLEHRLEYIGKFNNIYFYNDSISTIPKSTELALEALRTKNNKVSLLLLGGMDRGLDYSGLVKFLYAYGLKYLICFPDTGYEIYDLVGRNNQKAGHQIKAFKVESMQEAVKLVYKLAKNEDICLLSPAAASYNQYKNFAERGNYFKHYVEKLA